MSIDEVPSAFLQSKSDTFIGEVNRELLRVPKARTFPKECMVAEAMLGMYMDYALSLEDQTERDRALRYGEYIIESLQVSGKYDTPSAEHEELPRRRKRIDTMGIRKTIVNITAGLVAEARREIDERTVVVRASGRFGPEILGIENPDGTVTEIS